MYELSCELRCNAYECTEMLTNVLSMYESSCSVLMLNFLFAYVRINLFCSHAKFFLGHRVQEQASGCGTPGGRDLPPGS